MDLLERADFFDQLHDTLLWIYRINKLSALLIITYRDDEVGPEHPLRLVLGDLPRSSVRRLRLPALTRFSRSANWVNDRKARCAMFR
jgi:hypothetical protein